MRSLIILSFVLLSGCGTPSGLMTSPGSELPSALDYCEKADEIGRCSKWHYGNGKIRPYDIPPSAEAPKP